MGKHEIAKEIEGVRINAQVEAEWKAEFYASDVFDHEFCADGNACDDNCPFEN